MAVQGKQVVELLAGIDMPVKTLVEFAGSDKDDLLIVSSNPTAPPINTVRHEYNTTLTLRNIGHYILTSY